MHCNPPLLLWQTPQKRFSGRAPAAASPAGRFRLSKKLPGDPYCGFPVKNPALRPRGCSVCSSRSCCHPLNSCPPGVPGWRCCSPDCSLYHPRKQLPALLPELPPPRASPADCAAPRTAACTVSCTAAIPQAAATAGVTACRHNSRNHGRTAHPKQLPALLPELLAPRGPRLPALLTGRPPVPPLTCCRPRSRCHPGHPRLQSCSSGQLCLCRSLHCRHSPDCCNCGRHRLAAPLPARCLYRYLSCGRPSGCCHSCVPAAGAAPLTAACTTPDLPAVPGAAVPKDSHGHQQRCAPGNWLFPPLLKLLPSGNYGNRYNSGNLSHKILPPEPCRLQARPQLRPDCQQHAAMPEHKAAVRHHPDTYSNPAGLQAPAVFAGSQSLIPAPVHKSADVRAASWIRLFPGRRIRAFRTTPLPAS